MSGPARRSRAWMRSTRHTNRNRRTMNPALSASRSWSLTRRSRRRHSSRAALERETAVAERDAVAVGERVLAHAPPVHDRAVRRVEVDEDDHGPAPADLRVAARDVAVVEHDLAAGRAPDLDDRALDLRALAVVHDHELLALLGGRRDHRRVGGRVE